MLKIPTIFLAFANDRKHPNRFLKALEPEKDAIKTILIDYLQKGYGNFFDATTSAPAKLIRDLNKFSNQIIIFHFSGHANGTFLNLENQEGENVMLHRNNLVEILKKEENLKLVFLNACATFDHVKLLHEAGIPAVLATTSEIADEAAKTFAITFYNSLVYGDDCLESAFDKAKIAIVPHQQQNRIYRGLRVGEDNSNNQIPWGLYINNQEILNWKISKELSDLQAIPKELNVIPQPPYNFTGREHELAKIKKHLLESILPVLITSIGGVGKTSLVKQYVYQNKLNYKHIAWISVIANSTDDSSKNKILRAVINDKLLFKNLDISFNVAKNELDRLKLIFNTMRNLPGRNLLVIDNVDSEIEDIRDFLPQKPNWEILLTSREKINHFKEFSLDVLPEQKAQELYLKYFPRGKSELDAIDELLKYIGYHTLTLELLAKICNNSIRLSSKKMKDKFLLKNLNDLDKKVFTEHSNRQVKVLNYLKEIFSIAHLNENQKKILCNFSIFPSVKIEGEQLIDIFQIDEDMESQFENDLFELVHKGWIIREPEEMTFRCHQLIQDIVRIQYPPNLISCKTVINSITKFLSLDQTKDNPATKIVFIPFAEQITSFFNTNDALISKLKTNLGRVYRNLGRFQRSIDLLESSLEIDLTFFDSFTPRIINNRSDLGLSYKKLGCFEKAKIHIELAVSAAEEHYGQEHPLTARTKSNLGNLYSEMGKYRKAEELLTQALEINNKYKTQSNVIGTLQSNLGNVFKQLEKYESAEIMCLKSLEIAEKEFEEGHPIISARQSSLAIVYRHLKKVEKAKILIEKALEADTMNFGRESSRVAQRQSDLALIYTDLMKLEEAKHLLQKAIEINIKEYGESYKSVAINYNNLAWTYQIEKDWTNAKFFYQKAYLIAIETYGNNHPHTKKYKESLDFVITHINS